MIGTIIVFATVAAAFALACFAYFAVGHPFTALALIIAPIIAKKRKQAAMVYLLLVGAAAIFVSTHGSAATDPVAVDNQLPEPQHTAFLEGVAKATGSGRFASTDLSLIHI